MEHNESYLVDRILRLVPAGIRSKRQPSAKSPGFKRQVRSTRPPCGGFHAGYRGNAAFGVFQSTEPPRVCRRLFGLSHAANAGCSSAA